jgi:hypothetical protein
MLRVLGLMGLGFLFRGLGTAEDVYATATPTPTPVPAPMQAVFDTGKAVETILCKLTSQATGNTWYDDDPNKDHTVEVHKKLLDWETTSRPSTYDHLGQDLGKIIFELDNVDIYKQQKHQGPKPCSGKTGEARVRCELEAIDMLVRQHYVNLNANHGNSGPHLGPDPNDPTLPDDTAIVNLSKDITDVLKKMAPLLDIHTVSSKSPQQ